MNLMKYSKVVMHHHTFSEKKLTFSCSKDLDLLLGSFCRTANAVGSLLCVELDTLFERLLSCFRCGRNFLEIGGDSEAIISGALVSSYELDKGISVTKEY